MFCSLLNNCMKNLFSNCLYALQYLHQNSGQLAALSYLLLGALTKATGYNARNFPLTHLDRSGMKCTFSVSSNEDLSCFDKSVGNERIVLHLDTLVLYLLPQFVKILCFKSINIDKTKLIMETKS